MENKITVITAGITKIGNALSENKTFLEAETTLPSNFEVDSRRITDEISKLLKTMDALKTNDSSNYEVDQIEFNLGIHADGKVGLFCACASIGAECSIKVTIKKKKI